MTESLSFEGDGHAIWRRVCALETMPLYWVGVRSLRVLERRDSTIRALVELNLSGTCEVTVKINAIRRTLVLSFDSGPFRGTQRLSVSRGKIEASWDLEFVGAAISSLWDESQLKIGTIQALEQLAGLGPRPGSLDSGNGSRPARRGAAPGNADNAGVGSSRDQRPMISSLAVPWQSGHSSGDVRRE